MQLHMLTFDTELDNTLTVQKGGSWIDKQSLELKAFHNEEDGQAYSNLDSVVQNFFVFWNYIYTGTPMNYDGDGCIRRIPATAEGVSQVP